MHGKPNYPTESCTKVFFLFCLVFLLIRITFCINEDMLPLTIFLNKEDILRNGSNNEIAVLNISHIKP